ncbi:phosphoglycerate mutase [Paractinoplanes abujensis]|uniref:Putative phosphomutase (TIGR03848 family) n=1 Tax=Paractinoplanes abujensis TaxID=882441 RepID=A0A7W7CLJ8_9ACTN|nr:histidine phosphatase family protein [Actinoplanes abujensis]MBB4690795.1 putative phosphomutase (TIGR03848 family) [Actinoplanes abujensis]GID17792.1 phosphoglycerate mutase [Actinoplanes abujensis]
MATVLLLRHGRTTANATGELAGRRPVELDDTGRAQATRAGERLRPLPLTAVVTSPLIRCRTTVELALPAAEPVIDEGLTECGYGDWEGRPLKELAKEPLWPVVQQHPSAAVFPGGEAMAAMSARAVATIRRWDARITESHGPDALWLACSHGDVIKAIVADAMGLHLDQFQRIVADPASISVIRYTPTRPFLVRLNDTSDLASLIPPPSQDGARSDAAVGGGAGAGA